MGHVGNGSTVQLVRSDREIVSRIMPEQRQLERLGSKRNCQRSAGWRAFLMIADWGLAGCEIWKIDYIRPPESRDGAIEVERSPELERTASPRTKYHVGCCRRLEV